MQPHDLPALGPEVPGESPVHRPRWTLALVALCLAASAGTLFLLLHPRLVFLSQQVTSQRNLRGIGHALHRYSQNTGGVPASSLQALVDAGLLDPKQLVEPASGHAPPACDYSCVLLDPSAGERIDPRWMFAWSDPQFYGGRGTCVMFVDGHAEFVREPHFSRMLAEFRRDYEKTFGKPPNIIPARSQTP
jgi:hypothetical protein